MKKLLIICLVLNFNSIFCQTLEETMSWIGMNSKGREFVSYSKKDNKLKFISVRITPGQEANSVIYFQEFNPDNVENVSVVYGEGNWNTISIKFKNEGTIVNWYSENKITKERLLSGQRKDKGIAMSLNADKELIMKYKKAYINLFLKLGVKVKDGDFF